MNHLSHFFFFFLNNQVYKTFQESGGKGLKSQGNKKHLSDDEGSGSDSDDDVDNNTFGKCLEQSLKQSKESQDNDEFLENEETLEEQNQLASFSKIDALKANSQSRKQRQSKKSTQDDSLNYIEQLENSDTEYFQPYTKVLDSKQVKSLSQVQRLSGEQAENLIAPQSSKKVSRKSKIYLFPNKDDSVTPKMITQTKNKLFQLYSLGVNQIFGEEDVMKKSKRSFSVKCNSYGGGVLLIIRKNIFNLSLLANSNSEMYLKKNLEIKEKRFAERVKMIQENIQKYKNYFFEKNSDNQTPKNPLRAKRKLVEKDCINIDDFLKASQKQVVMDKSTKLNDLNMLEKAKLKKDNAPLFSAEMITERINTFTSPNLKKIDLFNFKNDICKVENPLSMHTIFQNELKKVMKGQQATSNNNPHYNTQQNGAHFYTSSLSNIAAIASSSQPNTSRNNHNQLHQNKQDQKFIVKTTQQFHKPKLGDNTLKVNDQFMQTSISQNNSGLFNQVNSTQNSQQQNNSHTMNPPLLKKKASKSDPHIKLPPSIEQLNKMGQSGLLDSHIPQDQKQSNQFLAQKEQIKKDILLKQQYKKIEQANNQFNSPEKKSASFQVSVNTQNSNNETNGKYQFSRKTKAQEQVQGSHAYTQPSQNQQNGQKMSAEVKPVKKTIFLETFTKGFFKNMKGIFYKNFSNQQGSLNTYSSIQESLAKHVLDPSIKQFLKQNPGILASKEKQVEFLRVNPITDKPQIMGNKTIFTKSNPDIKQEDLINQHAEQENHITKRPLSAKVQKGNQQEIIKFNIFRSDQNSASSYKFNINKIKELNGQNSISPDKSRSSNKYKRTYSAMELDTNEDEEVYLNTHNGTYQKKNIFEKSDEDHKTANAKAYMNHTAYNFHNLKESGLKNNIQNEDLHVQSTTQQNNRFFQKQISLQPHQFDNTHQLAIQNLEKITLKIPTKLQTSNLNPAITYSTYNNFFKPSPSQHHKTTSNQLSYKQPISKTMSSLSPELNKNKGAINRIFGGSSLTNSVHIPEKNSPNLLNIINLNSCQKSNNIKNNNEEDDEELEDIYQSQKNDLFRQKIENDKNLIKMTNLFTQNPHTAKNLYKNSL